MAAPQRALQSRQEARRRLRVVRVEQPGCFEHHDDGSRRRRSTKVSRVRAHRAPDSWADLRPRARLRLRSGGRRSPAECGLHGRTPGRRRRLLRRSRRAPPAHEGAFVLGVECDGAAYHSSFSARDRDRLRQQVLEGLGWRIHRIWSTDWFRDPRGQTERLLAAIKQAMADQTH
ncbi:hypothetical protein [Labilithrix luteola]|uniref:hypothetical protein n=1 Tax=Labilithrix luteola TaxID=1391654 RepID=UPI003B830A06